MLHRVFGVALLYQTRFSLATLHENPAFVEVDCSSITLENYCNDETNSWCVWDESKCTNDYDPILFISSLDLILMSKGLITFIIACGCMIIYWFSGILLQQLKLCVHIDNDKLDKCQIYIFELIGLTLGLIWLLCNDIYGPLFHPNRYNDLTPQQAMDVVRGIAGLLLITWMYAIEMFTNKLRWSLKMHHIVTIFIGWYYVFLLDEFADFASYRVALAMTLYAFTEHTVFAQLLLYRTYPLFPWQIHMMSSILYVCTRLFTITAVCVTYYDWFVSDEIHDQLNGTKAKQNAYLAYFFIFPVANIALNIAQFQSIKALFYVTSSVRKRITQRNELKTYPRLQALYDIFIEFDEDDCGYWTMHNWKKFIFYHSTFIKHDTCIILWNLLGFQYTEPPKEGIPAMIKQLTGLARQLSRNVTDGYENPQHVQFSAIVNTADIEEDESEVGQKNITFSHQQAPSLTPATIGKFEASVENKTNAPDAAVKKEQHMKWEHFRKIFGPYLKSEKYDQYSVKQVMGATIQILLQTITNAQNDYERYSIDDVDKQRDKMHQLYLDVNDLIGDRQLVLQKSQSIGCYINQIETSYDERIMDKQLELDSIVENRLHKCTSTPL